MHAPTATFLCTRSTWTRPYGWRLSLLEIVFGAYFSASIGIRFVSQFQVSSESGPDHAPHLCIDPRTLVPLKGSMVFCPCGWDCRLHTPSWGLNYPWVFPHSRHLPRLPLLATLWFLGIRSLESRTFQEGPLILGPSSSRPLWETSDCQRCDLGTP